MSDTRVEFDEVFMRTAELFSLRSTCSRLSVGAVIVRGNHIIAQGYNGSISGHVHCNHDNHLMVDNGCKRTIHAEVNAILMCAKLGIPTDGATMYVTHYPCPECLKLINQAGIKKVYFKEHYPHRYANDFHAGVSLVEYSY
ncbi:dCMP deaminase [Listeria phage LIS04]|nr:dCMP deaminase [Listeria phage LIS04]